LNRVNSADSALAIEQSGAAIIEQIQRARERRSQITSEEMKAVIEERDAAITRVQTYDTLMLSTKGQSQPTPALNTPLTVVVYQARNLYTIGKKSNTTL